MPAKPKCLSQVYLRSRWGPVVVGDVLYTPGGSFGPRTQMDFQLVVIHRGDLHLKLDEQMIHVPEKYGILLSPGHREHFYFSPDCETRHSWVAVTARAVAQPMRRHLEPSPVPIPFMGRMSILLDMLRAPSPPRTGDEALHVGFIQGLALALLCDFASVAFGERSVPRGSDTVLLRFDSFLTDSYSRPLSLSEMSKGAGVSRQHLLKVCRAAGRPTPVQQLYRKRLEAAADLLLHTGFPLSQIAEQCGFTNPFHFSRKYKQFWGASPLSWRKKQWEAEDHK